MGPCATWGNKGGMHYAGLNSMTTNRELTDSRALCRTTARAQKRTETSRRIVCTRARLGVGVLGSVEWVPAKTLGPAPKTGRGRPGRGLLVPPGGQVGDLVALYPLPGGWASHTVFFFQRVGCCRCPPPPPRCPLLLRRPGPFLDTPCTESEALRGPGHHGPFTADRCRHRRVHGPWASQWHREGRPFGGQHRGLGGYSGSAALLHSKAAEPPPSLFCTRPQVTHAGPW